MSQGTFPVKERIFLVTENKFPVTWRTKNTSCHRKHISLRRRYISCDRLKSLYYSQINSDISCDKKILFGLIFFTHCLNGTGPSVNWYLDCQFLTCLSLVTTLHWLLSGWWRNFFPLFRAKLFLENYGPTKFQILSHPGMGSPQTPSKMKKIQLLFRYFLMKICLFLSA